MQARSFSSRGSFRNRQTSHASERSSLLSDRSSSRQQNRLVDYKLVEEANDEIPSLISGRYSAKILSEKTLIYRSTGGGLLDNTIYPGEAEAIWNLNYNEAAIYLEEGEQNEKLSFHPRDTKSLLTYRIVHNDLFYVLDLLASITLLCLAMAETPAVDHFRMRPKAHATVELICLAVISVESFMRFKSMGSKAFAKHPRSMIKAIFLLIMAIQAVVILFRGRSHVRVFRALRPVFLLDSHFCSETRRTLRQLLQALPAILDIIVLLIFIVTIFSLVGFSLFVNVPNNTYFKSFSDAFANMFVVISNGNFPDIMMPVYAHNRWSALFFVVYIVIQIYYVLNVMLAVAYDEFAVNAKEKFRKLYVHRRAACQQAFQLLSSEGEPRAITFKAFAGVVRALKPSISRLRCYLMFKTLDTNRSGSLNIKKFNQIYDTLELNWRQIYPDVRWFSSRRTGFINQFLNWFSVVARSSWTDRVVMIIIVVSLFWEVTKNASFLPSVGSEFNWVQRAFITFYGIEALIKIIGLGPIHYSTEGWNPFDFIVMVISVGGHFVKPFGRDYGFLYILRTFRIVKLFKRTRRYQNVMGPFIFIVIRQLMNFGLIVFVVLYFYAIVGMELFSKIDLANPPPDVFLGTSDYYTLNNFSNILNSIVTLFVFMFGYTWFFLMDRYAKLVSTWSRLYFMGFYLISTVILTIVVASILEAFLFTITCRRRFMQDDDDDQMTITRDVYLNENELVYLGLMDKPLEDLAEGETHERQSASFRGQTLMTKFLFGRQMYAHEVPAWEEEFDGIHGASGSRSFNSTRRRAASAKL